MRGMHSAKAEIFATIADLPREAQTLLDDAPGIFAGRDWWNVVLAHALPAGATASFVAIRSADRIVAVLPMQRSAHQWSSLTTPYTCLYTPLLARDLDATSRIAAMTAFAAFCRPAGSVRLDALPAEWDGLSDLLAGVRQAGLRALRFDHFGNWFEPVAGLDWPAYLERRPGALRQTIRRRLRRAATLAEARFELLTQPNQMDQATSAFETVYRRSWKQPEPFPTFNVAYIRAMAAAGSLRFGLWSIGQDAVAVQVWVVKDGHAAVLKLAHDEAFKLHSPGTVLTALMLRHLLDQEHVVEIDFGRGDDEYKQGWAARRRQRSGLLLVNPWRPSGAAACLRHVAGQCRAMLSHRNPPPSPNAATPG